MRRCAKQLPSSVAYMLGVVSTRQNFKGTTASWPSGGIKAKRLLRPCPVALHGSEAQGDFCPASRFLCSAKWDTIHFEVTERLTIVFASF
ncbi:hypothetical protein NL676_027853 [Syzygium grande]|nr:hypothetical protein NL676_027853 [Syzygium grande]